MRGIARARVVEAVVVVGLLAGTGWLARQLHHNYVVHPQSLASAGVSVAPVAVPATLITGMSAPLTVRGVERASLLFVLSTDCPFCEQNMPAWRRLVQELAASGPGHPATVVLSVSSAEETRAYLARHGLEVAVRLVDRAVLPLLGVTAYPATVAIDPYTGAISSWTGVLGEPEHQALAAWAAARPAGSPS